MTGAAEATVFVVVVDAVLVLGAVPNVKPTTVAGAVDSAIFVVGGGVAENTNCDVVAALIVSDGLLLLVLLLPIPDLGVSHDRHFVSSGALAALQFSQFHLSVTKIFPHPCSGKSLACGGASVI